MNGQDVILGILMKQPTSGYDIRQKFQTIFSYFFDAGYGTIYPTLAKMEKEGMIVKENVVQEGRPNKNVYTITDRGREQFHSYLQSPLAPDVHRSDLLVRLHFGDMTDPALCERWLAEAKAAMETLSSQLSLRYKEVGSLLSPTQDICIKVGLATYESALAVFTEGLEKIKRSREG